MSNIDEVKTKIKEGKLDEAMAMAMVEAMKLEIITNNSSQNNNGTCRTSIDVLANEIEHDLGDNNLENFHFSQVEQAHDQILQNIQNLQQMFTLLQESADKLS